MLSWDDQLVEALDRMNIETVAGARYMDDIRMWLHAVRLGWRVMDGTLAYRRRWRDEERAAGVTALEKTTEILKNIIR